MKSVTKQYNLTAGDTLVVDVSREDGYVWDVVAGDAATVAVAFANDEFVPNANSWFASSTTGLDSIAANTRMRDHEVGFLQWQRFACTGGNATIRLTGTGSFVGYMSDDDTVTAVSTADSALTAGVDRYLYQDFNTGIANANLSFTYAVVGMSTSFAIDIIDGHYLRASPIMAGTGGDITITVTARTITGDTATGDYTLSA